MMVMMVMMMMMMMMVVVVMLTHVTVVERSAEHVVLKCVSV